MAEYELAYTVELPQKVAMQGFFVGPRNIYAVAGQMNQCISKCPINGNKAKHESHMTLKSCGHSQTLEYFRYKNKDYFMGAIKPQKSKPNSKSFAIQLGFFPYSAGKTYNGHKGIKRITNITDFRMECGLSTNKKKLLIISEKSKMDSKGKSVFLHYLDFDYVKQSVLAYPGRYMPLSMLTKTTDALTKPQWKALLPYGESIQGAELTNGNSIIIVGGNKTQHPVFHKIRKVKGVYSVVGKYTFPLIGEVENLQIRGDYIYFGFVKESNKKKAYIYRLRKDVLC